MADVMRCKKDKVITYGGLQSNHVRMTAAACAALGLQAHLFFFEPRPSTLTGNLLLNELFGSRMYFIPFGNRGDASLTIEFTNKLVHFLSFCRVGPGAYFMPVGGHNVTGCLGYVEAACELQAQVERLDIDPARVTIVTAVGTGGTLAGLMAGLALLDSPMKVLGIDVGKLWKSFPASLARLAGAVCTAVGYHRMFRAADVPLVEDKYVGPGYAVFTPATGAAVRLLAESEGIVLDPVYSGKAFAGLLDLIGQAYFQPDNHLIFLHSGGFPGVWAYAEELYDD
jgi:L-cysteate sulfo-lyase